MRDQGMTSQIFMKILILLLYELDKISVFCFLPMRQQLVTHWKIIYEQM